MAVALLEDQREDVSLLRVMRSDLLSFAQELESGYLARDREEVAATLVDSTNHPAYPADSTGQGSVDQGAVDRGAVGVGSESAFDRPTRAQELLDRLVSACRIALAGDGLPATGGHRPQVMVTINCRDLLDDPGHDGHSVFAQQISAGASGSWPVRPISCPLCSAEQGRSLTSDVPNASSPRT